MLGNRFPSAPLLALLPAQREGLDDVAARAGYSSCHNMRRVLRRKSIGIYVADRIAVALGLHPVEIYPCWYIGEEDGDYEAG